eukprot:m.969750 g.969750  ORF g.969750 m.969750 type:complete len:139 (-) comp23921_c0_seq10:4791-5207(-)
MPLHRSLYNIILTVDARLGVCCVSFPAGVPATAFFTAACVVSKLDALESARLLLWFVFCAGVTFPGEIGYSGIPELSCTEEPSVRTSWSRQGGATPTASADQVPAQNSMLGTFTIVFGNVSQPLGGRQSTAYAPQRGS